MAQDDSGQTLDDLSTNVASWYRRRLQSFFRRTLNQGFGPFLFSVLFLVLAMFALKVTLVGGRDDQRYVAMLMQAKNQPQSEASRAAALSLLLAGMRTQKLLNTFNCEASADSECTLGREIMRRTQFLIALADEVSGEYSDPAESAAFKRARLDPAFADEQIREQVLDNLRARCAGESTKANYEHLAAGSDCPPTPEEQERAARFVLTTPLCRTPAGAITFEIVPQQVAHDTSRAKGAGAKEPADRGEYRVQRASLDAELFDLGDSDYPTSVRVLVLSAKPGRSRVSRTDARHDRRSDEAGRGARRAALRRTEARADIEPGGRGGSRSDSREGTTTLERRVRRAAAVRHVAISLSHRCELTRAVRRHRRSGHTAQAQAHHQHGSPGFAWTHVARAVRSSMAPAEHRLSTCSSHCSRASYLATWACSDSPVPIRWYSG